jgi:hypothetical protein
MKENVKNDTSRIGFKELSELLGESKDKIMDSEYLDRLRDVLHDEVVGKEEESIRIYKLIEKAKDDLTNRGLEYSYIWYNLFFYGAGIHGKMGIGEKRETFRQDSEMSRLMWMQWLASGYVSIYEKGEMHMLNAWVNVADEQLKEFGKLYRYMLE